ncbi:MULTISPECIES: LysR family transcriptional regulator [Paenibacillus]|uniref:LysR family transcriptional regulator n=1 Tax=Paenibacillus TaxID=44249 RepID=UPI001C8E2590|nr:MULTISPECIES: LysR family transcriptional regulator [Paenibacillus]MBY0009015.1 LysR family transcriptional regulator [Paenibacillus typhae]MDF9842679.1 LysR family transcriptional activator of glutamate synthase operon [Paenibacillus sp. PastF-2]MDF9849114.1 LysR family transcriptional activator of glutamate synthase operon [Paenibacillus sp. PastM-2]MDF9855840.1 LysR family transcriptional activator of glutamate synthase operon [Paenibacillus sp. PastF-1]MDH6480956.1 LysR family transcrip
MELRQLQYFLKVAQKEHVTKAAEELHVAQSAVSRQIHQLEQELGVDLFMQKGRNLQLTPVGQLFCKRVETLLKDLERSVAEVHEFLDPELGEIRIGFPHSLGTHLIPSIVAEFRRHYPNVRFRFKQGTYASLIKDVSSGEVDLAFISPFPENDGQVAGDIVMTEELFAILPQHHPLAGETVIRLEQLRDEKFVLFSQGYSLRPIVWQACIQAGFKPQIAFEGGETDTIRGLVAAGMGVSLLPETALYQTNPMQPAQVRVVEPAVTRTVGIIHRSDGKLPLVARSFRTFLLTYFKDKNNNNPEG